MLAFLRGANTARSVSDVFDGLYSLLGIESFKLLFPVILTDNGSEFSAPLALEKDADGIRRSRVFYCDPSSSFQKGAIENNHELIRRIIPKGKSFNGLSQPQIQLMMDHINSYNSKEAERKVFARSVQLPSWPGAGIAHKFYYSSLRMYFSLLEKTHS